MLTENAGPFMQSPFLMPEPKAMLMPSSIHDSERLVIGGEAQVTDPIGDAAADDRDIKWIPDQVSASVFSQMF